MDNRPPAGLTEQRALLVREISLYRHAFREHVGELRDHVGHIGGEVARGARVLSLAPAAGSFLLGLLRVTKHRRHRVRNLVSTLLTGFTLYRVLLKR